MIRICIYVYMYICIYIYHVSSVYSSEKQLLCTRIYLRIFAARRNVSCACCRSNTCVVRLRICQNLHPSNPSFCIIRGALLERSSWTEKTEFELINVHRHRLVCVCLARLNIFFLKFSLLFFLSFFLLFFLLFRRLINASNRQGRHFSRPQKK